MSGQAIIPVAMVLTSVVVKVSVTGNAVHQRQSNVVVEMAEMNIGPHLK